MTNQHGQKILDDQQSIVIRLQEKALSLQSQFDLAEQTAFLLDKMLDGGESSVEASLNHTHERHAFLTLRIQLFRILVVDLYACVLDKTKRSETASVRLIWDELKSEKVGLEALRAFHTDPAGLDQVVLQEEYDQETQCHIKAIVIEKKVERISETLDKSWKKIEAFSHILDVDKPPACRMKWVRNKCIAHHDWNKDKDSIVALDDDPPDGGEKLTWGEPIKFLKEVRPLVYEVFALVTRCTWDKHFTDKACFYAEAFWDRVKNGHTDLKPPPKSRFMEK